jgi:uncharacterized membrane protein YoaK (UPF0700 family)
MGARYSRNAGYTISKRSVSRPAVRATKQPLKFGPTTAKFFGLAILAILAFVMVSSSGKVAISPYSNSAVTAQISETQQNIDALKIQADRYQTLDAAKTASVAPSMVPADPNYSLDKGTVAGVSTGKP